jgi:hypothetical protein
LKTTTLNIIRTLFASRIGWINDAIGKGAENAPAMARDLVAHSDALADFLAAPSDQAPTTLTPLNDRAEALMTFLQGKYNVLVELEQAMDQGAGKGSPAHKLVRRLTAFVSDPNATEI